MVSCCAVASCPNNAGKTKNKNVIYHGFPKDKALCELWISLCNRAEVIKVKNARICSDHFVKDDYEDDLNNRILGLKERKILKKWAIPSRNIEEGARARTTAKPRTSSDSPVDPLELEDGDTAMNAAKRTRVPSKKSTSKKRKKEAGNAPGEATSSACSQDDSSSSMPLGQPTDCGPSTSGRNIEEIEIKQERVKEELILEDYGNPNDAMEFQTPEGIEGIGNEEEDAGEGQSSSCGTGGPFETIICGTSDVQIKQEIFEDESDAFNSPLDDEPLPSWTVPLEEAEPERASRMSLEMAGRAHKRVSKSNVKRSQKLLKAVPALSLEKCQICVNEVFSSPSDLVEHCILKHSDASSKFFPAGEPSVQEPHSASTTPGFSAATSPGLSVANPPGQPPEHWIPPYISACDVFDGVFVSLRNIPMENRKATRDKILELVSFLSKSNVDPITVNFSVTEEK